MHKKSQTLPNMKIAEIVKEFRSKNEKAFRQVKTDDFLFSIFCANYLFFSKGERLFGTVRVTAY